jgi:hypothetical protein
MALVVAHATTLGCSDGQLGEPPPEPGTGVTAASLTPRRLRLLTRREYNATVRDLLFPGTQGPSGMASGGACQSDADCDVAHQSCVAASCAADPCNLRTFTLAAGGKKHSSVAVAGSFNGWQTGAPDWQMTYLAAKDLYVLKHSLDAGAYQYKLVLDGQEWITDPTNSATVDDGQGQKNSALTVTCPAGGGTPVGGGAWNPARDFPPESRPSSFAFDDNADAGLVTTVHVEQYLAAAESLATDAVKNLASILPCDPAANAASCAEIFARTMGKRAFRRPLADDEVAKYAKVVTDEKDFATGVSLALRIMLSSPYFLYRFEIGAPRPDGAYQLTGSETATALSYLFWGTMPDQALFDAADHGDLATSAGVEAAARRLMADPRSRTLVEAFAVQWLGVEGLLTADKNAAMFPGFDASIREAMLDETRRFVSHVVFDGSHTYRELLTSDTTFASGPLAALYGVSGVSGAELQQITTPAERHAGLLGQGSVLATYAKSDQTSPVHRGLFVRRRLLCEELPPPPANIPPLPPVDPTSTTRERLAQHTADPACGGCHQYIDGVGFGFERFDAVGRYRTTENGKSVDASGDLNDAEKLGDKTSAPFATLPELGAILADSDQARACFSAQVYRFASGALEAPGDGDLASIQAAFSQSGDDVQELFIAVTRAPGFLVRK